MFDNIDFCDEDHFDWDEVNITHEEHEVGGFKLTFFVAREKSSNKIQQIQIYGPRGDHPFSRVCLAIGDHRETVESGIEMVKERILVTARPQRKADVEFSLVHGSCDFNEMYYAYSEMVETDYGPENRVKIYSADNPYYPIHAVQECMCASQVCEDFADSMGYSGIRINKEPSLCEKMIEFDTDEGGGLQRMEDWRNSMADLIEVADGSLKEHLGNAIELLNDQMREFIERTKPRPYFDTGMLVVTKEDCPIEAGVRWRVVKRCVDGHWYIVQNGTGVTELHENWMEYVPE